MTAAIFFFAQLCLTMLSCGWLLFCLTITTAHAQYWNLTGSLNTGRYYHTATLLPHGNVLVAGGNVLIASGEASPNGVLNSAELYNPTGVWIVTGSLTDARYDHTATLLLNGNVLVAAGTGINYNTINSAELYNPTTGLWTVTGSLTYPRDLQTATLLPNGNVLVAAGAGNNENSAEVYTAITGVWTVTGSLAYARQYHTATQLPNGNVLVAGGSIAADLNTAELYNPTTGVWTLTGNLTYARYLHTATLIPNGNVLVAGGDIDIGNTAELYNVTTGIWTVTGSLTYARIFHTATLLFNGNVLVAGGVNYADVCPNSTELYNVITGSWTLTGSLTYTRIYHTATLRPNGNVLVAGGFSLDVRKPISITELYIPKNSTATPTPTSTPTSTSTPTPTPTPTPTVTVTTTSTATAKTTSTATATFTSTSTNTAISTSTPTSSPSLSAPTPASSSPSPIEPDGTTTSPGVVASPASSIGAIVGGVVAGFVGLLFIVVLFLFVKSRSRNKPEINNTSLKGNGYSQPMDFMSDIRSQRPESQASFEMQTRTSSELMTDMQPQSYRVRSDTNSSFTLQNDILIPFASLKLGQALGDGHFGQVFQANYRGAQVAVKKLRGVDKQQILEEAKMMKSVPLHPNVLHYYGVSEQEGEYMMVTELCDKGNLSQYLRNSNHKLSMQQCRHLCCQIASGMWHISTHGIIHRDLRAENIFLSSTETKLIAKVADFGLARSLNTHDPNDSGYYRMTELKPIPVAWTAPEVMNDSLKYVAASDVWSFGVLLWEIYSKGAKPFEGTNLQVVATFIRDPIRNVPLLPRLDNCPDDIFNIMNSCWAFNPQDRPTFEQLYNQLS